MLNCRGLPQSDSISIRVYENHKVSRAPTLIGSTSIRLNDLEKIDGWFPVRPVGFEYQGFNKKSVGELSIAASVTEQIVLSSIEYQRLLLVSSI